jgi:anti-sigma factor RsiW
MSCTEVRTRLLLAEMDELQPDGEIGKHLASCPGCTSAVMNIRIGTAAAGEMLNSWTSHLEPNQVVEQIQLEQASARYRSEQWWSIMGTAAIVLISLLVYLAKSERMSGFRAGVGFPDLPYISSFTLRCLQPEAAAEIGRAILAPTRGSAQPAVDGDRAVVLSGARRAVVDAELAIKQADGTLDPRHPRACPMPSPNKR